MRKPIEWLQWLRAAKDRLLLALRHASGSAAGLLAEARFVPFGHGMDGKAASLRALLRKTKLRAVEDGHAILEVCGGLWAANLSGRRRKQNVMYLWVIALGVALGLLIELSLQISALLPPNLHALQ